MKYTYLYQNKSNQNCSGEIEARNRADAYTKIRKMGIRPYRVIGDDPFDWQPIVFWGVISVAVLVVIVALVNVLNPCATSTTARRLFSRRRRGRRSGDWPSMRCTVRRPLTNTMFGGGLTPVSKSAVLSRFPSPPAWSKRMLLRREGLATDLH